LFEQQRIDLVGARFTMIPLDQCARIEKVAGHLVITAFSDHRLRQRALNRFQLLSEILERAWYANFAGGHFDDFGVEPIIGVRMDGDCNLLMLG